MNNRIYLDNNAATALDPEVLEVMIKELSGGPSNPSSVHAFGQAARGKLIKARKYLSDLFKVCPSEVIFTSGATEALNMVIRGLLEGDSKGHVITSNVEHLAVFNTLQAMQKRGLEVEFLPAGLWGAVRPEAVEKAIRPNTRAIVLMAANNETGVLTDIEAIAAIAKKAKVPFIVDGVAWLGKIGIENLELPAGVSAICFSAPKFHGPHGTGFAIVRSALKLVAQVTGGVQEFERRGGTENLAGIIGLVEALRVMGNALPETLDRIEQLRNCLEKGICSQLQGVFVNGEGPRVANTANLAFDGVEGESLLMNLDLQRVAVSHGSACSSGALEPSRILTNMGLAYARARSSIRFSLSRFTTQEEIDATIKIVTQLVNKLKI